ncbi:MAG: SDR family NAD(P)-dependent oxidoreductase [Bryobacteraceae bacterium]
MEPSTQPFMTLAQAFSLQGELALITGGATGIGRAMAHAFIEAGARVVLVGRRRQLLESVVAELGPQAGWAVHDVAKTEHAPALIEDVRARYGEVTILVNNAGHHLKKTIEETDETEFRHMLDTHVTGAYALTRAVIPSMIERHHGHLLFTASMTSFFGLSRVFAYSTAKSAYLGMVRSLAVDLSPKGIRVNAIAPGFIETEISRRALDSDPARKSRVLNRTPLGRLGTTEDVAWAAVYLCSPAARFVNGVVLPVDGGVLIGF